ncbi:MAG: hypothetical protein E7160_03795 [Firmicutes bacterium]|nr:hypothetical protein [Bacillota bacterium]
MDNNFGEEYQDNDLSNDIDVNRQNEDLYNNLIENSRRKTDDYWDRNNPVVKGLLIVLLIIGVVGFIYYVIVGLNMK